MKTMTMLLVMLLAAIVCACNPDAEMPLPGSPTENPAGNTDQPPGGDNQPDRPPQTAHTMKITIGSASFTATLEDNATVAAFRALLPMTIGMDELNGNEKYYYFSTSLPSAASNPGMINTGDIMLYGSSTLVLFYETFPTSYTYTKIGRVDNVSGLKMVLGSGNVTVKYELMNE